MAELADRSDRLRLPALEVADEVPAERIAVARVLRLEILRTVLADDLDAGVDEQLQLVHRDVLRRNDDGDRSAELFPHARVALGDLLR